MSECDVSLVIFVGFSDVKDCERVYSATVNINIVTYVVQHFTDLLVVSLSCQIW